MALFDISTLGVADNKITFNDDSQSPLFRARGKKFSFGSVRQFDTPLADISGINDYKTLLGQVNFVIAGKMYPDSDADYENGLRILRSVSDLDLSQADALSDTGYVPYVWQEADQAKQVFLKVLFPVFQENNNLTLPFSLYCKIKFPRIFGTTLRVADTGSQPGTPVGNSPLPFILPIALGKTLYTISSTQNNAGNRAAYPESIVINGPVNNPKLTNTTTGKSIQVNVSLASITDQLVIKYNQSSISILLNGVSVYNQLSTDSTLFLINPGQNNFQLTGSSIGTGAYARVSFYDAWSLA